MMYIKSSVWVNGMQVSISKQRAQGPVLSSHPEAGETASPEK